MFDNSWISSANDDYRVQQPGWLQWLHIHKQKSATELWLIVFGSTVGTRPVIWIYALLYVTTCLSIALPIEKLLPSITSRLPLPLIRFNLWRKGMVEKRNCTKGEKKRNEDSPHLWKQWLKWEILQRENTEKWRQSTSFQHHPVGWLSMLRHCCHFHWKIYKHYCFLSLHLDNQFRMCMVYLTLPCCPSNPILVSSVKFFSPNTLPPPSPRSHGKKKIKKSIWPSSIGPTPPTIISVPSIVHSSLLLRLGRPKRKI